MTSPTDRLAVRASPALVVTATLGWVLLLVLSAGRLSNNITATLHRDEAIAWTYATLPVEQIPEALAYDVNPPLYFLALHAWLGLGEGDTFIRGLSMVAVVAAALVAFDAARRVATGWAGLLASVFVLLAPSTVAMASLARPYALAYLVGMLALHGVVTLLRGGGWGSLLLLGVSGGLLPLTHYWGGLLLVAIMAGLAVTAWLTRQAWIVTRSAAAVGIGLLATLPWAGTLGTQLGSSPLAAHGSPSAELLGRTLTLGAGGRAAAWVLGVAAVVALVALVRRHRAGQTPPPADRDAARVFLVAATSVAFGVVLLLWVVSQVRPLFSPNYAYIVLAPTALLVGVAMSKRWWTAALVVAALLLAAVPDAAYSMRQGEDDSRVSRGPEPAIGQLVLDTTSAGDTVLTSPGRVLAVRYYTGGDLDYVTPIGRVFDGRFDYRDRVERLQSIDSAEVAKRIAGVPAGTRIAVVHDIGPPRDHPYWVALDDAMDAITRELRALDLVEQVESRRVEEPYGWIGVTILEVVGE